MTIRPAAAKFVGGIYVIIDPDHCGGRDIFTVAEATASAGAAVIQLRHKNASKSVVTSEAQTIAEICRRNSAVFIVNDHADIAAEVGADGVHVGQGDLSIAECRAILNDHQIVGKSNALLDEALASFNEGADYIAVGSIYQTDTKSDTRPAGLSTLHAVSKRVTTPIVAIGGIKPDNVADVARSGADCICVATAVTLAPDPGTATLELVEQFAAARGAR